MQTPTSNSTPTINTAGSTDTDTKFNNRLRPRPQRTQMPNPKSTARPRARVTTEGLGSQQSRRARREGGGGGVEVGGGGRTGAGAGAGGGRVARGNGKGRGRGRGKNVDLDENENGSGGEEMDYRLEVNDEGGGEETPPLPSQSTSNPTSSNFFKRRGLRSRSSAVTKTTATTATATKKNKTTAAGGGGRKRKLSQSEVEDWREKKELELGEGNQTGNYKRPRLSISRPLPLSFAVNHVNTSTSSQQPQTQQQQRNRIPSHSSQQSNRSQSSSLTSLTSTSPPSPSSSKVSHSPPKTTTNTNKILKQHSSTSSTSSTSLTSIKEALFPFKFRFGFGNWFPFTKGSKESEMEIEEERRKMQEEEMEMVGGGGGGGGEGMMKIGMRNDDEREEEEGDRDEGFKVKGKGKAKAKGKGKAKLQGLGKVRGKGKKLVPELREEGSGSIGMRLRERKRRRAGSLEIPHQDEGQRAVASTSSGHNSTIVNDPTTIASTSESKLEFLNHHHHHHHHHHHGLLQAEQPSRPKSQKVKSNKSSKSRSNKPSSSNSNGINYRPSTSSSSSAAHSQILHSRLSSAHGVDPSSSSSASTIPRSLSHSLSQGSLPTPTSTPSIGSTEEEEPQPQINNNHGWPSYDEKGKGKEVRRDNDDGSEEDSIIGTETESTSEDEELDFGDKDGRISDEMMNPLPPPPPPPPLSSLPRQFQFGSSSSSSAGNNINGSYGSRPSLSQSVSQISTATTSTTTVDTASPSSEPSTSSIRLDDDDSTENETTSFIQRNPSFLNKFSLGPTLSQLGTISTLLSQKPRFNAPRPSIPQVTFDPSPTPAPPLTSPNPSFMKTKEYQKEREARKQLEIKEEMKREKDKRREELFNLPVLGRPIKFPNGGENKSSLNKGQPQFAYGLPAPWTGDTTGLRRGRPPSRMGSSMVAGTPGGRGKKPLPIAYTKDDPEFTTLDPDANPNPTPSNSSSSPSPPGSRWNFSNPTVVGFKQQQQQPSSTAATPSFSSSTYPTTRNTASRNPTPNRERLATPRSQKLMDEGKDDVKGVEGVDWEWDHGEEDRALRTHVPTKGAVPVRGILKPGLGGGGVSSRMRTRTRAIDGVVGSIVEGGNSVDGEVDDDSRVGGKRKREEDGEGEGEEQERFSTRIVRIGSEKEVVGGTSPGVKWSSTTNGSMSRGPRTVNGSSSRASESSKPSSSTPARNTRSRVTKPATSTTPTSNNSPLKRRGRKSFPRKSPPSSSNRPSPSLPSDIIDHIVSFTLLSLPRPHSSFHVATELRNFALVNRQWNDIAMRRIKSCLWFGKYETLETFLRLVREEERKERAEKDPKGKGKGKADDSMTYASGPAHFGIGSPGRFSKNLAIRMTLFAEKKKFYLSDGPTPDQLVELFTKAPPLKSLSLCHEEREDVKVAFLKRKNPWDPNYAITDEEHANGREDDGEDEEQDEGAEPQSRFHTIHESIMHPIANHLRHLTEFSLTIRPRSSRFTPFLGNIAVLLQELPLLETFNLQNIHSANMMKPKDGYSKYWRPEKQQGWFPNQVQLNQLKEINLRGVTMRSGELEVFFSFAPNLETLYIDRVRTESQSGLYQAFGRVAPSLRVLDLGLLAFFQKDVDILDDRNDRERTPAHQRLIDQCSPKLKKLRLDDNSPDPPRLELFRVLRSKKIVLDELTVSLSSAALLGPKITWRPGNLADSENNIDIYQPYELACALSIAKPKRLVTYWPGNDGWEEQTGTERATHSANRRCLEMEANRLGIGLTIIPFSEVRPAVQWDEWMRTWKSFQ